MEESHISHAESISARLKCIDSDELLRFFLLAVDAFLAVLCAAAAPWFCLGALVYMKSTLLKTVMTYACTNLDLPRLAHEASSTGLAMGLDAALPSPCIKSLVRTA